MNFIIHPHTLETMQQFHGNWIDLVIVVVLLYFASEAWRVGFWAILADFISFFLSLVIALTGYQYLADILKSSFSFSYSLSNALGFLLTAIIAEGIMGVVFNLLLFQLPETWWRAKWSKIIATIPALGEGLVLIAFILTLVISLPLSPKIKKDVSESMAGGYLIEQTTDVEKKLNHIFGGVVEDSLTYLTIKPGSEKDCIPLTVKSVDLKVENGEEQDMFGLVNNERKNHNINKLVWDPALSVIAQKHAEDMWKKQYFCHYSPEGSDVGDRLEQSGYIYLLAGENLALAPTLKTAHQGLMNSEGHRANILDSDFNRLGIGVIDNGVYGKMFVQVFTN